MLLAALGVVAAACTGGASHIDLRTDATAEDGTALPPPPREPEVSGGCDDRATTNPRDLDATRAVARCGPDAPAPEPLDDTTTLRVAVPAQRDERLAPVLLADELGELAAERLDVELVTLEGDEVMAALEEGEVDVMVGALDAPFFDAVARGSGARIVLGGSLTRAPYGRDTPQPGLWVRSDLITGGTWNNLVGRTIALPGGAGSATTLPTRQVLGQNGLFVDEVAIEDDAGERAARRLLDRDVAGAWLDGTAWLPVARDERFELVTTPPASEALDGTVMAGRLLEEDRAVGEAYARAVIRTVNTYLSGDYRSDEDVVAMLADALGVDAADLAATPPPLFDWEIRAGTAARVQKVLIEAGAVAHATPLPPNRVVDRGLARGAVTG